MPRLFIIVLNLFRQKNEGRTDGAKILNQRAPSDEMSNHRVPLIEWSLM
jgi:hypothetical protein